ncbi:hypothetical protein B9Z55_000258 [Caenorhabditis nigoni]|uniref:CCHC-type domain-containing protein n=1 Tax=Caenorhabditis nigoni TaxID=1611254 RepID=A0A2G5VL03_9PELO|nr:hypothetical protein B9Z55_000258 [Caenorhabditis nigoni]
MSEGGSEDAKMLALAKLLNTDDSRQRRQPHSRNWFRPAGAGYRQPGVRSFHAYNNGSETNGAARKRFGTGEDLAGVPGKKPVQCYSCGQYGHYSSQCGFPRWRERGVKVFLYLDDGLILAKTREEAENAVRQVREDLEAAGVCVAEDKSHWEPSQEFTWLGVRGDLKKREIRLTEKREISLRNQIEKMKKSLAPSILDRQVLCGYLSSLMIIAGDQSVARQRHNASTVAENNGKCTERTRIPLSLGEKRELIFWEAKLREGELKRRIDEIFEPRWWLYTDASAIGLGAVVKDARGTEVLRISKLGERGFETESSAMRELKAVEFAAERMAGTMTGQVLVHSDSQAAVHIMKKGSMKIDLHVVAERIWESMRQVGNVKYIWIPREQNEEADEASRTFDYDDWAVQDWVFQWAQKKWGRVACDWFANEQNAKTPKFYSKYPDPKAAGADVFEHIEEAQKCGPAWWAPPPLAIPRLIGEARRLKLKGILAMPLWKTHVSYQALVDREEGPRQEFLEEIMESSRNRNSDAIVQTLMTALSSAKAASTMKAYERENEQRRKWIIEKGLPLNEVSTVMYLAWKSESVGSGSLAKISAAYKMVNNEVSIPGAQCVTELINSKKRAEATTRKQPLCINEPVIEKIMSTLEDDAKSERDVLLVHLSYSALLRASEASNLQWKDLKVKNGLLEVFVAEAKNDQLGKGRTTFVHCKAGSDLDLLLKRWRVRCSLKNPEFIFHNLHNLKPLCPSSISSIVKAKFDLIGVQGSHHALRRGRANDLQAEGYSLEEIQRSGRWRSAAGMSTYLRDNPRAQGIRVEEMESEEEEEEGPPSLTREAPVPL